MKILLTGQTQKTTKAAAQRDILVGLQSVLANNGAAMKQTSPLESDAENP